ncbi:MAG: hypothetical protein A3C35_01930 [Omnitrophica bacterium RIFCSPHIGHO2_02_FULL_46_11]|nr:MAG: hypothetical protein A3A81_06410 [Omnitrophica bacterium RIFCSPLOWO2_01_FULL_45_10b]OGW85619.1 MAG: hypothetical protein A3C35_01930 [Omnitrophica bacterium RIFCSPHIGHO2_02_FULL_46_11]
MLIEAQRVILNVNQGLEEIDEDQPPVSGGAEFVGQKEENADNRNKAEEEKDKPRFVVAKESIPETVFKEGPADRPRLV